MRGKMSFNTNGEERRVRLGKKREGGVRIGKCREGSV